LDVGEGIAWLAEGSQSQAIGCFGGVDAHAVCVGKNAAGTRDQQSREQTLAAFAGPVGVVLGAASAAVGVDALVSRAFWLRAAATADRHHGLGSQTADRPVEVLGDGRDAGWCGAHGLATQGPSPGRLNPGEEVAKVRTRRRGGIK